jgi:hypothetical protein
LFRIYHVISLVEMNLYMRHHLGLADTKTSGITVSLFHGYLINSHNFEMQIHIEANYITRNNIFDHIIFFRNGEISQNLILDKLKYKNN